MKKGLILSLVLSLLMLAGGFGMLVLSSPPSQDKNTRAWNYVGGRPDVVVVVAEQEEFGKYGYGGAVRISGILCDPTGNVPYSDSFAGTTLTVVALPDPHFELKEMTIWTGVYSGGNFVKDSGSALHTTSSIPFTFSLDGDTEVDYLAEVEFAKIKYDLNFSTEYYFDGSDANLLNSTGLNVSGCPATVSIGDNIQFSNELNNGLTSEDEGFDFTKRFCYVQIGDANISGYYHYFANGFGNIFNISFDKSTLDKYANMDTGIEIVGVYSKTLKAEVSSNVTNSGDAINVLIVSYVPNQKDGQVKSYFGEKNYYPDEGSDITVFVSNSNSFKFTGFTYSNITPTVAGNELTVEGIDSPCTITVAFNTTPITFDVYGFDGNQKVSLPGTFVYDGNGIAVSSVVASAELKHITFVEPEGYRLDAANPISIRRKTIDGWEFVDFVPKSRSADGEKFIFEQILDNDFINLNVYVSTGTSEIRIRFNLTKLYALNVSLPSSSEGLGCSFEIRQKVGGSWDAALDLSQNKYFEKGSEFQITAVYNDKYRKFNGFTGVAGSGNVATFTLNADRTIMLNFAAEKLQIRADSNENVTFSRSSFFLGDTLVITFDVPEHNDIKEWWINSKKHTGFSGNTLTVQLTEAWLAANGDWLNDGQVLVLKNDVKTGWKDSLIAMVTIPAVAIPLLLVILIVFLTINIRRKRFIKAQLIEKRVEGIKRNVGGYVSDLRQGKNMGVTKADVKQAMKEQKQTPKTTTKAASGTTAAKKGKTASAKGKPTAAKKEKTGKPVAEKSVKVSKPAKASIMVGTSLQSDLTFIDKNKKVVATMEKDGTIKDKAGNAFASARMQDGAILDNDGNVVGLITGDGTIVKQD